MGELYTTHENVKCILSKKYKNVKEDIDVNIA